MHARFLGAPMGYLVVESFRYYAIKNLFPEHFRAAYAIHTLETAIKIQRTSSNAIFSILFLTMSSFTGCRPNTKYYTARDTFTARSLAFIKYVYLTSVYVFRLSKMNTVVYSCATQASTNQ